MSEFVEVPVKTVLKVLRCDCGADMERVTDNALVSMEFSPVEYRCVECKKEESHYESYPQILHIPIKVTE